MTTLRILWAILCVTPSLFPAYFLFLYKDPGAGNFGWEMFLGFFLFWGSMLLAIVLSIVNCVLFLRKPDMLVNRRVTLCFMIATFVPLIMGIALLCPRTNN